MHPVLNNTKWEELRLAMVALGSTSPKWRARAKSNGYVCPWDGDWYYHFRIGGYKDVEWVELQIVSEEQGAVVLPILREIHLPGCRLGHGFRLFGYVTDGMAPEYI